jgi:hypothetical protein
MPRASRLDIKLIELFAALAAITLAEAQRADHPREAITSRDLIGQAKGIIMERYKVSDQAAFAALVRTSQTLNMKLTSLARHLVETGELFNSPGDGPSAWKSAEAAVWGVMAWRKMS